MVERLVRPDKAGHAGTLDPLASGVLIVCVGQATRLVEYVQRMPKRYRGTFLLGRSSTTEDVEGDITLVDQPVQPTRSQVEEAACALVGNIQQRPPAFSALKIGGHRAYDLARAGKPVELAPRPITIHQLAVVRYDYPEIVLDIECSSGTYVRSLGRDLAERLGTAAIMSALIRTAIGRFRVEDAVDAASLTSESLARVLIPASAAVEDLPRVIVGENQIRQLANGLAIRKSAIQETLPAVANEYAAVDDAGRLVAILAPRSEGVLGPTRYFPPS